jgi:hypothetical protein
MDLDTKSMEVAARAVHETYFGKDTWKAASPDDRGRARQAVRVTLSALERTGKIPSSKPAAAASFRSPPKLTPLRR